ncbi:YifB family Mg chelatase-like AAA ATPase [Nocardioides aurantiacus]|uniref:Magnesium chelatase family protein n=1 Tax=Nocardioides aurantiacus TaxID=86796 RepID=A0A3N2CX87_9ACTN|nr:YifB family Mg chelatase-like AAA ATPase [Nocardioides aurantiacus]ROR92141.1 magnesium chelatase family protein [Nocardioides aurantiacus]
MVATTHTVSLQGTVGHVVDVQVDLAAGVVGTSLVGRPDTSINEARDRCKAAIGNTVFDSDKRRWPNTRRVTILLSPTDLPKRGPHFDLAIAVAVLAAADPTIPASSLRGTALVGELTLDGRVRCVPGVLPMVMAAAARGIHTVFVPEPQVDEARMVEGLSVFGIRSLGQTVALLAGEEVPDAPPVEAMTGPPLLTWRGEQRLDDLDLADVLGIPDTRYAVEVAAAGGHHLLLTGPKGSGKTTIAERIPGLLPDLTDAESLELTAVHSLCGSLPPGSTRIVRPPFRNPHHSASRSGILGGGTGRVRPGDVSKAHLGVLFLDEFPLFPSDVVDALREPLEAGEISISRGEDDATFPARAMFVFASNPCRCGEYHPWARDHRCTCSEQARREYRAKVSGPVADRIDITRFVEPVRDGAAGSLPYERPESSAEVRVRVAEARRRQAERYAGLPWRLNAHAPGPVLREEWPLAPAAASRLEDEVMRARLTRRGAVRAHRVAWSVADLAGLERPGAEELDVALRLRSAAPLLVGSLPRSVQGRTA